MELDLFPETEAKLGCPVDKKSRYISKGALISNCERYRYLLWREWRGTPNAKWRWIKDDDGSPILDGAGYPWGEPKLCLFIMLNPSIANGEIDDPTIRRCVSFAKSWGYERLEVVNLFAYRATEPRELLSLGHNGDPAGLDNLRTVQNASTQASIIVCAWGAHGRHLGQDETVLGWIDTSKTICLGRTKEGFPRHPLYVKADAQPQRYP